MGNNESYSEIDKSMDAHLEGIEETSEKINRSFEEIEKSLNSQVTAARLGMIIIIAAWIFMIVAIVAVKVRG